MTARLSLTLRDLPAPGEARPAAPCPHVWQRVPDTVGFSCCRVCSAFAVCPGCLNSLNVGLRAADAGLVVIWCAAHDTEGKAGDSEES